MNIVMSQSVKDMRITMDLRETPLDEAINLVVRAAGLSYEIIGGSILIADAAKLKEEVGQTGYVVNLAHANAKEVQVMLKDLSKNIQIDEGGNRLVCLTSPRVINEIRNIVEAVDKAQLQVTRCRGCL
jgi:type II secretory pathway component GspD/PulD (secretin)